MKNYYLILFTIFFTSISISQNNVSYGNGQLYFQQIGGENRNIVEDALGSPYIEENFQLSKFKKFGNTVYYVRYNAYLDNFEVKLEDKVVLLKAEDSYEITLNNTGKKYIKYNDNIFGTGFYVVLKIDDKVKILKKEKIDYKEAEPSKTGYDVAKPAKFSRLDDEYYLFTGNELTNIPASKRKIISVFPELSKNIKSFIKEKNIDLKDESDMIVLISFIAEQKKKIN
jgi:hypothetical protein